MTKGEKISKSKTGYKVSDETKNKLSIANKGSLKDVKNYDGVYFGRLKVISELERYRGKNGDSYPRRIVSCLCYCGKVFEVQLYSIKSRNTKSCGCLAKEVSSMVNKKHGGCGTKLHNIYRAIKSRCNNPNNKDYFSYGGRGIICEWVNFEEFRKDMGSSHEDGLSIERNDVNKNYCKDNCRWIPHSQQQKNKQNTIYVIYQGEKIRLQDLCVIKSKNYHTVWQRIKKQNKSLEDALL